MVYIFWRDKLLLLIFIGPHLDTLWGAVSQVSAVFSHLGMIWCEVMNHVEYLKGSGQMMLRSLFI